MAPKLKPIDNENLGQRAYLELRLALAEGRYRAGERVRLRDLADELGTSVTPVREAVLQLVNDGALHMKTPRDIRVRTLSADEYLDVLSMRKALEVLAIDKFVVLMKPRHLTELEKLEERHQAALKRGDYVTAVSMDRRFMFTIFDAVSSDIFLETLDRLWLVTRPTVSLLYSDEGTAKVNVGNHDLLAALQMGDASAAKRARCRLIDSCAEVIVEMLQRLENEPFVANG